MKKKMIYPSLKSMFPLLILILTFVMSIGYAVVNSIVIGFDGEVIAKKVDGIFITDVTYFDNVGADLNSSVIVSAYQTNLISEIYLSDNNIDSFISYEITIYNSTDQIYRFVDSKYMLGDDTYDNTDISFKLDGLQSGSVLGSKESITFKIIFYYNNSISVNNRLKSIINFDFEIQQEIVQTGTLFNAGNSTDLVFNGSVSKSQIEKIYTKNNNDVPDNAITSWDASVEKNGSIVAWTLDDDGNGVYELYLGSVDGKIFLPENSSYMFSTFSSLNSVDLTYFDTSNVTDMSYMFYYTTGLTSLNLNSFDTANVINMGGMFYYTTGLTSLDLSNFNTSNVTNMNNMFYYMYNLTNLDLSSFDTANVTSMNYMFAYSYKIATLKLNNASFGKVTQYSLMFYQLPSTVYIISKDDVARDWIQEKLGSGKGTIVTVSEL